MIEFVLEFNDKNNTSAPKLRKKKPKSLSATFSNLSFTCRARTARRLISSTAKPARRSNFDRTLLDVKIEPKII